MTDILTTNFAESTLDTALAAGGGTVSIQTGDGALFPTPTGTEYFRVVITRASDGAKEVIKVTTNTGDDFTVITRAQEGTTALAFEVGDRVELCFTAQGIQDKIDQELAILTFPRQGADSGTVIPTVTADGERILTFAPSSPGTLALPTTKVLEGDRFILVNLATNTANGVRVNASGGTQVTYCPAAAQKPIFVEVMALQDAPTTTAHWAVIRPPRGIIAMDTVNQTIAPLSDGTSFTLPADLLYADGMVLKIAANVLGSGGGSDIDFVLGATTLFTRNVRSDPAGIQIHLARRGSASQFASFAAIFGALRSVMHTTATEDLTTALTLKTYNSDASLSTDQEIFSVELL